MQTFATKQAQVQGTSKPARSNLSRPGPNHDPHPVLSTQRASGKGAARQELQSSAEGPKPGLDGAASSGVGFDLSRVPIYPPASQTVPAKFALSRPGEPCEKEADKVADQVIAPPAGQAGSGTRPTIGRFGGQAMGSAGEAPGSVNRALAVPGSPIEAGLRRDMEQSLGHDFSRVRVHNDAMAVQSARDVNARAYTLGHDIVFGTSGFQPETHAGRRLIAHELAHVVQQTGGAAHGPAPGYANTIMRQAGGQTPPGEQQTAENGVPDWVRSIMGDPYLGLTTQLRAMAMGVGLIDFEPKTEDEFLKDQASKPADEPEAGEHGLSSDEAGKQLTEQFTRNRAVDLAKSKMGADWHAPVDSAAYKTARGLHGGDPAKVREQALTAGMEWAYEHKDQLQKVKDKALARNKKTKSPDALKTAEAADGLLKGLGGSLGKPIGDLQVSLPDESVGETAWKSLGSENAKKYLEKVGFPLGWFTTCVTLINPTAEAAGADTKKWGPLDMFDKRRKERFKEAQESKAWVPAENKVQPKPGDIIIFVSYQKGPKGVVEKDIGKASFQHVSILIEPVSKNPDGTERWVTADGGKGSSHKGEDKTGTTERRYNPATQQFITGAQTNLQEAAEGGRYLLGFWNIVRLPQRPDAHAKKGPTAKTGATY
jgi:hypothetical protein